MLFRSNIMDMIMNNIIVERFKNYREVISPSRPRLVVCTINLLHYIFHLVKQGTCLVYLVYLVATRPPLPLGWW